MGTYSIVNHCRPKKNISFSIDENTSREKNDSHGVIYDSLLSEK